MSIVLPRKRSLALLPALVVAAPMLASANGAHTDPTAGVAIAVAAILVAAMLGGHVATRLGQPAVLGELLAGVVIGNLGLVGLDLFAGIATDPHIDLLANLGVLLLLFEVGLESSVAEMAKVGVSSFVVAILGVVAPLLLGWGVGAWLLPDEGLYAHLFLGATLSATSVGITARVLQDLGRSQTGEARVILGAAVIDDVLGLILLAGVVGLIAAADQGGSISWLDMGWILVKAVGFLGGALLLGTRLSPGVFRLASRLRSHGALLLVGLSICFVFSWAAHFIGLAPIVGAFAAGLVLEEVQFEPFVARGEPTLGRLVSPIAGLLVPIFFVVMGMRTDLRSFAMPGVLFLAVALIVAGVVGKLVAAAGVMGKGMDALSVGIGMIPRGEVGLIFANIGLGLTIGGHRVVDPAIFSAIVVVVMVTTLITPPALKWSMERRERRASRAMKAA
ncbi:cation:proton antiporter [Vulgatibacter incomptus]|uniref:Na+/H+ antiporter n=1 Tax=Vulgatibacter incomptus TaxID=1391653 RepID=A0A0K1PIG0_9BACT|nr:cation:proton antiporter [Vulgatibacter incomptus]AKU92899.1 Na+/H+ antiporter [Vulgatibacter incomptus]